MTIYPATDDDILDLTIRFSSSIPDLPLTFVVSTNPNVASLKQRIRQHLTAELQSRILRLIHNGKLLTNDTFLRSLRARSHPPTRVSTPQPQFAHAQTSTTATEQPRSPAQHEVDGTDAKGKTAVRNQNWSAERGTNGTIWIHCAIGFEDQSHVEAEEEARLAARQAQTKLHGPSTLKSDYNGDDGTNPRAPNPVSSPPGFTSLPAPRGFDRLLDAGFSPSDVQSLRIQFLAIQSHTHTPDTMPTPEEMRHLEDRWLDNSTTTDSVPSSNGATNINSTTQDEAARFLDDSIYGTVMGFFWPIGCLIWGLREDGIMSPSRKIAVALGIVLNLGLGFVKFGG